MFNYNHYIIFILFLKQLIKHKNLQLSKLIILTNEATNYVEFLNLLTGFLKF